MCNRQMKGLLKNKPAKAQHSDLKIKLIFLKKKKRPLFSICIRVYPKLTGCFMAVFFSLYGVAEAVFYYLLCYYDKNNLHSISHLMSSHSSQCTVLGGQKTNSCLSDKKKKYDLTSHRWLRINKQRSSGQKIVVTK